MTPTANTPAQSVPDEADCEEDVILSVKGVSKKFCKTLKRSMAYGIIDLSKNLVGIRPDSTNLRRDEFWAIDDINFELKRGDVLGLIGVNGSGKTTLLRLLSGIFPPDKGEITVRGRTGALIAVGAGFHPHLTGRENIYLNSAILGINRAETDAKFQDIVDFAEIGTFLDSPVGTYSSGMRVRLGFSIATAIQPDLLLLDEILAVGDRRFIAKCYDRIGEARAKGATVFVSHNMAQISRICTSVLLVHNGEIAFLGSVSEGVRHYNSLCSSGNAERFVHTVPEIQFNDFRISSEKLSWRDDLSFQVRFTSNMDMENCKARMVIVDETGQNIAEWRSCNHGKSYSITRGDNVIEDRIPDLSLRDNKYYLTFVINPPDGFSYLILANRYCSFVMAGSGYGVTNYQL
jgi:lipopolysaccharide transport system ATP-binding protein